MGIKSQSTGEALDKTIKLLFKVDNLRYFR